MKTTTISEPTNPITELAHRLGCHESKKIEALVQTAIIAFSDVFDEPDVTLLESRILPCLRAFLEDAWLDRQGYRECTSLSCAACSGSCQLFEEMELRTTMTYLLELYVQTVGNIPAMAA